MYNTYYKQQYPTNTYQYNAPIDINTLCHNYIIVGGAEYNAVDFSAVDNTYSISSMDSDHIYKIKEGETLDDLFRHVRKLAGFDI